jgi:myosin heavy subunit
MTLWRRFRRSSGSSSSSTDRQLEDQRHADLQSELEVAMQAARAMEVEISSLKDDMRKAREQVRTKDETLAVITLEMTGVKKEVEELKEQAAELQKEVDQSRQKNQALANQIQQEAKDTKAAANELLHLQAEHNTALGLLEIRTSELKLAQAFLPKTDTLSDADVTGIVNSLNTEIFHTATLITESFTFKRGSAVHEQDSNVMQEACSHSSEVLGQRMVDLLRSTDKMEGSLLVRIAIQACINAFSQWIIESWYFGTPQEELLLAEIYQSVQHAGGRAVLTDHRCDTDAGIDHGKSTNLLPEGGDR